MASNLEFYSNKKLYRNISSCDTIKVYLTYGGVPMPAKDTIAGKVLALRSKKKQKEALAQATIEMHGGVTVRYVFEDSSALVGVVGQLHYGVHESWLDALRGDKLMMKLMPCDPAFIQPWDRMYDQHHLADPCSEHHNT